MPDGTLSYNCGAPANPASMTSNHTNGVCKAFAYDSENHLVSRNGGAVQIVYDGDGNRVAKSVNGVVTRYLVDDMNPTGYAQVVEELNGAGVVERQYTYGLERISQNQPISNAWTVSFYGYDGGGSVRNLTNSNGAVTDTYEYDAFGNSVTSSGTTPNNYMYRGEQWDSDLGLYYLRARYYNPFTGRFMSRDPNNPRLRDSNGTQTDPKELHKYLYAGEDPINFEDPNGRELFDYEELTAKRERETVAAADALRGLAACLTTTEAALLARWESGKFTDTASSTLGVASLYFCYRVWAPYFAEDVIF